MSLLNRAQVKRYTLDAFARRKIFKRVSGEWYDWLEEVMRTAIDKQVHGHPSCGVTIRPPIVLRKHVFDDKENT